MNTAEKLQDNTLSVDALKAITEQHLLWLQTDGREGRRANLAEQNLSNISLRGIYMPEANFRGAILIGTDFEEANLQGADFSGAQLEQTNFRNASLEGSNFQHAQAQSAYFDRVSATQANFSHIVMEGATATNADFSGVNFRDAILTKTDFSGSKLQQATLRYSKAVECTFDQSDLAGADCRDVIFDYTCFKNARLIQANMRGASFEQVLFTETDFSHVIDLDPRYQTESLELEKQSIRKEIENLVQVKEEVSQFESKIQRQREEILQQRKVLAALNKLESEASGTLLKQMNTFRRIAVFWFVFVSLLATIVLTRAADIGLSRLNAMEMGAASAVLVIVLAAHIYSATFSYNVARKFAHYVRLRREKLNEVPVETSESETINSENNRNVTYL